MADTTIITKLSNGNVLVDTTGNQYTLNPDMQVFKDLNDDAVEVRDKSGSKQDEFLVEDVLQVVREDATVVPIPDQDTLFNELSTFFFFKLTGVLPFDAVERGNTLFVSTQGVTIANGAVRESLVLHFSDIEEARDAAEAGDIIVVAPGTYTILGNLYDADIEYDFKEGAIVNSNNSIFSSLGSDVDPRTFRVTGSGTFNGNNTIEFDVTPSFGAAFENLNTFIEGDVLTGNTGPAISYGPGHSVIKFNMVYGIQADSIISDNSGGEEMDHLLICNDLDNRHNDSGTHTINTGELGYLNIICPTITKRGSNATIINMPLSNDGSILKIKGNIVVTNNGGTNPVISIENGDLRIEGSIGAVNENIGLNSRVALSMSGQDLPANFELKNGSIVGSPTTSIIDLAGMGKVAKISNCLIRTDNCPDSIFIGSSGDGDHILTLDNVKIKNEATGVVTSGINKSGVNPEDSMLIIDGNVIIDLDEATGEAVTATNAQDIRTNGHLSRNRDVNANINELIDVGNHTFNPNVIII